MNRILLRSVREYKRESFLTPVLVCLEVFMEVLIPLLMAKIIDVGIANGDMGYIIKIAFCLFSWLCWRWRSARKRGRWARSLLQDMRRTCVMTFFIKYRIFHSEISIISPRPAL